ncbi:MULTISPECIES: hypothetical protein [unclassified Methylobacterium]|jgi:hypothetical protein|uniref:hypothetical protein n=1 Tax=unclassified Methylobacterium TaxID=2615210 RepID=UPI001354701D|nr:hypothetical protein [Methylobacterium sp. 2A]MWV22475.1 hypothetical protein [Methylobacterium sp. 2A]
MSQKPLRSRIGILAVLTPAQRRIAIAIRKANASSVTAAHDLVSRERDALQDGIAERIVAKRDVPVAFEAANDSWRARRVKGKRGENLLSAWEWFGHMRRQPQANETISAMRDRQAFARDIARPIRLRLDDLRNGAVIEAAKRVMRHGGSGGTRWQINADMLDAGDGRGAYRTETQKVWGKNDNWPSQRDHHSIFVSKRWLAVRKRIGDGDGTVCGSHLLLDAIPFLEDGGRAVFEARLARPGRGYSAVVEDLWLSCYGRKVTIHRTLKAALSAKPPRPEAPPPREASPEDDAALADLAL